MTSNTWHEWVPARSWTLFNTWFSLLVICVSAAATLDVPIGRAAWPILILCSGSVIVLAVRSLRPRRTRFFRWQLVLTSALILGAVIVVLWGSLMKDEFVSVYPDPWSYSAFATYIQSPKHVIRDGSQPVLSFGAFLAGTRYGTAGLLALFAEISGTDPCRSAKIYAFLVLLQIGLGFTLLARVLRAGSILSVCTGLFGVIVGWAPEILKIGNWDQVLFLSFVPFALLRIRFSVFHTSRRLGILGLGICLGAAAVAYPEGAALAGVIYLPSIVWRLLQGEDIIGKIRRLAIAGAVALLLSSVYLPTFASFLYLQILRGKTLTPGNGAFGGLLSARWLPAIYGLAEQPPITGLNNAELIVPLLFVGLSSIALTTWWRRKDGILLTVPVFILLTLWQCVLLRYDYGFYKVLTMFWPVMVVAIFAGMSRLLAWFPPGLARSFAAAALFGVVVKSHLDEFENFQYAPWHAERRINPFLELTSLKSISGNAPICIVTQSEFNQEWAVFFLQGYKLVVPNPLGHLREAPSGLNNRIIEPLKGTVLLSDEKKQGAIWHNEIFSFQNHLDPVELLGIDAPNGVETVQGNRLIWLNNQFAYFTIHSDSDRRALLEISECWPGPNRPGNQQRTLIAEVNGKKAEWPASSNLKVPLMLNQGNNLLRLSCKESPTVDRPSPGDTRTMLLGIKGLKVTTRDKPVELLAIDAPNGVEIVQSDSFIWLNNEFANLTIDSDAEQLAFLTVRECWPGPSRPGETNRTLIVEINGAKVEIPASPNLKVPLKLNQGNNLVRLSCKETSTVNKLSSGDTRTLLLGIKGFSVSAGD